MISDLSVQLLMNGLGRLRAFDSELSFDSCTPTGSASAELRLPWICTSEKDQWPSCGDSAKSSLVTALEGKLAKATGVH